MFFCSVVLSVAFDFCAMGNSKTTIADKQYLAKILFTRENLEQKIVALRVGVTEKTMSKWVNDGKWRELRRRMLVTKEHQINTLYGQLENLNNIIEASEKKHADNKQADILIKLTASIRNLETDLAIADLVESGMRFIKYLQQVGTVEQVIEVAEMWNSFIQVSIKK